MKLSRSKEELEYQKGVIYLQSGKTEDAFSLFQKLEKSFPNDAAVKERLGFCCVLQSDWKQAEHYFRKAVSLAPHNAEILNNLGCALQKQDRWGEAAECFEKAVEAKPSHSQALRNLALCLLSLGNAAQAIIKYQNLLALAPNDYSIRYQLAELLFKTDQLADAQQEYAFLCTQLPKTAPEAIKVHIKHALVTFALGQEDKALSQLKTLSIAPQDLAMSLSSWAKEALYCERYKDAATGYGLLARLYPDNAEYRSCWLINLYVCQSDAMSVIPLIQKAMADFPAQALFPKTLAIAYGQAGLPDKALKAAQHYIDVAPDDPIAYVSYASLLRQHQKSLLKNSLQEHTATPESSALAEVIQHYVTAIKFCDENKELQQKVVQSLIETKEPKLVQLVFDDLLYDYDLEDIDHEDIESAAESISPSITKKKLPPLVHSMIKGYLAIEDQRLQEAHDHFHKACAIAPEFSFAWCELADTLYQLCRISEARMAAQKAVEVKPNDSQALIRYGSILSNSGDISAGLTCCERALAINPQDPDVQFALGVQYLRNGQWKKGWALYDARLRFRHKNPIDIPPVPRWDGNPCDKLELIICPEQGLGDIIQFARFIPLAAQKAKRVIVVMRPALVHLFQHMGGNIEIVPERSHFHVQRNDARWTPIMDLPRMLKIGSAHFADPVPYITIDPVKAEDWKHRLSASGSMDKMKIGIAWQGNPQNAVDVGRSIPLHFFEPLSHITNLRLISLQKNHGLDQLENISFKDQIELLGDDFDAGPNAFADTLGVMANLDLVITSDTSLAHLAGALNIPVWLGLKFAAEWRWQMNRNDSPWYPSMRLFRQSEIGNWESVLNKMAYELQHPRNKMT